MTTIPDFKAQGLSTSDHDLGGAMSQAPVGDRGLPRLDSVDPDLQGTESPSHPATEAPA